MRALTEEETRMVFEKLHKFIGKAIKSLVSSEREDVAYCLRLQKGRVYYVREDLMRRATNVARDKLVGLGVCIGKFTHGGKFRLTVGSLDVLAKHAKYKTERGPPHEESKNQYPTLGLTNGWWWVADGSDNIDLVWVKPSAEMSWMYGNHIAKAGLGRITENTPGYTGVVVYSMSDVPLGFGVTAKSTGECRAADPNAIVVFHQADVGEYLRAEDEM